MLRILFLLAGLGLYLYQGSSILAAEDGDTGFACGPQLSCDSTSQYCAVVVGGPGGMATGYSCVDVPNASSAPTCDTVPIPIGCVCAESGGGIILTTTAP